MSRFTVSHSVDAQPKVGSGYLYTSGMYDVTIKKLYIRTSEDGKESFGLIVEHNGTEQGLFGPSLTTQEGAPNERANTFINALACLANVADGAGLEEYSEMLPIGKGKAPVEVVTFPDIEGLSVTMWLKLRYGRSSRDNSITSNIDIQRVYQVDSHATTTELIVGDSAAYGAQYEKDSKFAADIAYSKVTPDEVEAWKASQKDAKGANKTAPKTTPTAASSGKFATFGKK